MSAVYLTTHALTVSGLVAPEKIQAALETRRNALQKGTRILIRLGERRLYLYQGDLVLARYPIAIGREGWRTPTGDYAVIIMQKDPIFQSFKSGRIVQPGPDNPLGPRLISFWTDGNIDLAIHGTNQEERIGSAVSHGCIRMRNQDVIALYDQIEIGTPVIVRN